MAAKTGNLTLIDNDLREGAMHLEKDTLELLPAALRALDDGYASLPPIDVRTPGQERMAAETGMSRPTITRAIHELQSDGWLEVRRRGLGLTNIYVLKYRVTKKRS